MRASLTSFLIAAALGTGCSTCGRTVERDALDEELPEPICQKIFECCSQAEVLASQRVSFDDQAGCVATYQASVAAVFVPALTDAEDGGRARYDARAAADCISDLESSTCEAFSEQFLGGLICGEMIEPRVRVGQTCKVNFECTRGTCVIENFETEEGTCRVLPGEGEQCLTRPGGTDQLCAGGLICVDDTCLPPGTPGTPCTPPGHCLTMCDEATNTCAERGALGDPCFVDEGCRSRNCAADDRCGEALDGACDLL